nr:hypothetical protein [Tanacetum cinerariifolium]
MIIGQDNANSSNEDVNVVTEKSEEEVKRENVDIQNVKISGNNVLKLVDIVNSFKLENKLASVLTQISKNENGIVTFDDEIIELGSKKWNLKVCGQFIGCSMGFNKARYHIRRMWSRLGLRDVITKNDVFYFKFQDEEGIKEIPVWVKLLNVLMEAWSVKGINALASSIGKPVIMDEVTIKICVTRIGRIGFARLLMEIDAEKGIKDKAEIMYKSKNVVEGTKKVVDVEYSWIPCICSKCKVFGRADNYCKFQRKNVVVLGFRDYVDRQIFLKVIGWRLGLTGCVEESAQHSHLGSTSMGNSNGKGMLGSNRFTLLDSLVNEEELTLNTDQRKIIDEILSNKTQEMEKNEDVSDENFGTENTVLRNKVEGIGMKRKKLSKDLETQKIVTCGTPWVILSDFNVTLKVSEYSNRSAYPSREMIDFQECVNNIKVDDLHSEGFHYRWTKSLKNPKCRTLKKLDKLMVNEIPNGVIKGKGSFRFLNFNTEKDDFLPIVWSVSDRRFEGHAMYRVIQKMKVLKSKLKQLSWKNGNVFLRAEKLREKVMESQKEVDMFPHNENIKEKSCRILKEYYEAMQDENSLLCQTAKIKWLREGDRNTAYFHKTIKEMVHRGRIITIRNEKG